MIKRIIHYSNQFVNISFVLLLIISCEQIEETDVDLDLEQKTIIIDGEPLYAGYGYDPGEDRAFRNAIYPDAVYESTEIQPALTVSVETIDEQENLETFNTYYKVTTKKNKRFFGLFKKSRTTSEKLETRTNINNTRIAVIAKITVRSQRFLTDASATLIPPAKRLLEQNQLDRFLDNYGPYYVSDRTVGGEVYYAYVYEFCSISNWSKYEFKEKLKSSILKIFNKEGTVNVSTQDQQLINQSLQTTSILSDIPGFAPRIVLSVQDANNEIARIQNYLRQNPEKAITIDMELQPYETIQDNPALETISNEKLTCLENLKGWDELYQKIHNIYVSAKNNELKQQASSALQSIKREISKATICDHSIAPNSNAYESLLVETEKDQYLQPIHRYWNLRVGDHFYTTNWNELGNGKDGYNYEGTIGKAYSRKFIGTQPVYRYWNPRNTDHFYTTNWSELEQGKVGYHYEGIIGYVYPDFDCDRKPVYRYWNSGNGDHFYTTNYHELGGGAQGWKYEGIMGYVIP